MAAEKIPFAENSGLFMEKKKQTILNKCGFLSDIDFCFDTPYKYYDVSQRTEITPEINGRFVCVKGLCKKITSKTCSTGSNMIKAELECTDKHNHPCKVFATFFGGENRKSTLLPLVGQNCIAAGNARLFNDDYYISEPVVFQPERFFKGEILTVYRKHKGISHEWMNKIRKDAMGIELLPETIPDYIRDAYHIPDRKSALKQLHSPENEEKLKAALQRQLIEDLLYFACVNERERANTAADTTYVVRTIEKTKQVITGLPYALTDDQKKVLNSIVKDMMDGRHVSALVQGDVACGKSIVAFLLMIAMAENGYQSVLMAPTAILARQHFEELKKYADNIGISAVLLDGSLTAAKKKKVLEEIRNKECLLIVGTHAVFSESVEFNDLGLAIVDEEHRFGAKARNELTKTGCHSVNFTATPIPRTVAHTIYNLRTLYEIKSVPSNRKQITTRVMSSVSDALAVVKREVDAGNQAYIVCPYIDAEEAGEEEAEKVPSVSSVAEISKLCESYLHVPVGTVTGGSKSKEKEKEMAGTLEAFKNGSIRVLCATTVIEVGVNVPTATVIVVVDAYRFGLAQLHQLRGRVGRGAKEGFCILVSDKDTSRLHIMEETTDGFAIAQADYDARGGGDIIGTQQSGFSRFLKEAIQYPRYYASVCAAAKKMVEKNEDTALIQEMERRSDKIYVKTDHIKLFKTSE